MPDRPEPSPENRTIPVEGAAPAAPAGLNPKIKTFGGAARHEDSWSRSPNVTGTGAIHVRSFHSKLSDDGIAYLDRQINEWLDAHPQYEVKFVTTAVGEWTSKLGKEAGLVVQVWV